MLAVYGVDTMLYIV